jgi:hypothetical protein
VIVGGLCLPKEVIRFNIAIVIVVKQVQMLLNTLDHRINMNNDPRFKLSMNLSKNNTEARPAYTKKSCITNRAPQQDTVWVDQGLVAARQTKPSAGLARDTPL